MTTSGIHGSLTRYIESIVASGPVPGNGQHHFEGPGFYAYEICPDAPRGAEAAIRNASYFAEKKYGKDIGLALISVETKKALDLQHPAIVDSLSKFQEVMDRRTKEVGFRLENDSDLVRPRAHLSIEA